MCLYIYYAVLNAQEKVLSLRNLKFWFNEKYNQDFPSKFPVYIVLRVDFSPSLLFFISQFVKTSFHTLHPNCNIKLCVKKGRKKKENYVSEKWEKSIF